MKLVHLSDIHLGFRQYQRQTPTGMNQREADAAAGFVHAISKIIEIKPDLVLIAGDVFHNVRPSNPAILHAFLQLSRLRDALPDTDVVIAAGNHDMPRTSETGCILRLFEELDIRVADSESRRIELKNGEVQVLAVPHSYGARPSLTSLPGARYNVLLIHAEVEGIVPRFPALEERATRQITPGELNVDQWDYIALGHYHIYEKVGERAYYSGSLDYTSSNFWSELVSEADDTPLHKGFIEHDLSTGEHIFHKLQPVRVPVHLGEIDGSGMSAQELDAAIRSAVENCVGGIADKIVRLIVTNVPRHIFRELDHRALRDFKREALHFQLDAHKPETLRTHGQGAPGRRASLAETVRDHLRTRNIAAGVNRDQLVELGMKYLSEADANLIMAAASDNQ